MLSNDAHAGGRGLRPFQWLILLVVWVGLLLFWSSMQTGSPITKDAADNLSMGMTLKAHGVIANTLERPLEPSMFREPLPAIGNMLALYVVDAFLGRAPDAQYFAGERALLLKRQNLLWLTLLSLAIFVSVWRHTGSYALALTGFVATSAPLPLPEVGSYMVNSLCTETPAAALLAWGSYLAAVAIQRESWRCMLGAGLLFAGLTLVKGVFLFVTPGLVLAIPLMALLMRNRVQLVAAARLSALLGVVFVLIVAPWLWRNHTLFGQWNIASRGGEALYTRALMNEMSSDEYLGALMLSSPYPLNAMLRVALGYSREEIAEGRVLQSLGTNGSIEPAEVVAELAGRPEDTVTFYRKGRAEHIRLSNQLAAAGDPHPYYSSDALLIKHGLERARQHPFRHILYTFWWLWGSAFFIFPALVAGVLVGVARKDPYMTLLATPAIGMILFYALVSFNFPRYGLPAYPSAIALGLLLLGAAASWRRDRRTSRAA